jgi:hypothetical protein
MVVHLALADLDAGGVGALNAALGAGGVIGALAALAATGRVPLGHQLWIGTLVWGAPLLLIALQPTLLAAAALFLSSA